jgi:phosphatidylglycerophosphate synthase
MREEAGLALIYVPDGADPRAGFSGRTLVERATALARAVGLRPMLVAKPRTAERLPADVPHLDPGGRIPVELPPRAAVYLWRCDVVFVAGALRRLAPRAAGGRVAILDDLSRPAIVHVTAARLAGVVPASLDLAATGAVTLGTPGSFEGQRLIALSSRGASAGTPAAAAEVELVASLENPRDGLFDRLLNRHLSRRITPHVLHWPVTPNQVTLLSLVVGLGAAACLALPGYLGPIAGALLLQLTAVLDCIDGEIARAKVLESEWGELLDITTDSVIHVVVFLGMAVHAWPELGSATAWALGALFATGGFASFVVVTRAERSEDRWRSLDGWQSRLLAKMLATLTTRDLSVLVFAAAATGMLTQLLVGAAFGAHAFWVLALALHLGLMRRLETDEPALEALPSSERSTVEQRV